MTVKDIRQKFIKLLAENNFTTDKSGVRTVEIIGACFLADEETIFGEVNKDYVQRELEWYKSTSLNVNDIPGGAPEIWKRVADPEGYINSNYGNLIWSSKNCNQYRNVLKELKINPGSRRATMVYTRPSIWIDYNKNGRSDFICTNAVGYFIRQNKLHAVVQLRSNDGFFGYRNDRAWQVHIQAQLANELNVEVGDITWCAASLHFYERHFHLIK